MLADRASVSVAPTARGKLRWMIEPDDGPVGWVTLTIDDNRHNQRIGRLGCTVGERFRGRGYATAAVRAVLPIAFGRDTLDLDRVEAIAAVENTASRRVLERTGFRFEQIVRGFLAINGARVDHARFALRRSDWEGSNER